MKYHNFVIQPGYAEDARLCEMRVSHSEGFSTIEEAMEDFRVALISFLRKKSKPKRCCAKVLKRRTSLYNFCPECGEDLRDIREENPYAVQELFLMLPMLTINEASSIGILGHFERAGWTLSGFSDYPEEEPCHIEAVGRWMARETDDRPFMCGVYPDGTTWSSFK